MPLTASKVSQGVEFHRATESNEVMFVPGTVSTTYEEGDFCTVSSAGLLVKATANAAAIVRVAKKTAVPANTVAFPVAAGFGLNLADAGDSKNATLVPVESIVPVGTKVLRATFKDHKDDNVLSYNAAGRYVALSTGLAADDYPNGAIAYVYDGKGAGQVNLVEDYDHTGGAVEKMLVFYRPFAVDLDSTSKLIVLSGEAVATRGIHPFGNCGLADEDEIEMDDHANDGKFIVYESWEKLPALLKDLQIPFVGAHFFS